MMVDKIAVFGDVHGRSDMLKALHNKIKHFYGDIPLQSCGDLVDRGPDSSGVIQYVIDNDIGVVIGNHDDWLRRLLVDLEYEPFAMTNVMGGVSTAISYGATKAADKREPDADVAYELFTKVPIQHREWFAKQEVFKRIELTSGEIYWILHAGVTEGAAGSFLDESANDEEMLQHFLKYRQSRDLLLWARPKFPKSNAMLRRSKLKSDNLYKFRDGAVQIFGHTIRNEVIFGGHYIAVDTGCGTKKYGQTLSAVILPDNDVVTITDDDLAEWLK